MKNIKRPVAAHGDDVNNPLGYAVTARDKSVMQMLEVALKQKKFY